MQSRSIRQLGIDHRRGLVDPATGLANEPLNEVQQVRVIGELHIGPLEQSVPLDEHRVVAVDQHVADLGIVHQLLDGSEAVDFIHQLLHHQVAIASGEVRFGTGTQVSGQPLQLLAEFLVAEFSRLRHVDGVDNLAVQLGLELLKGSTVIDAHGRWSCQTIRGSSSPAPARVQATTG